MVHHPFSNAHEIAWFRPVTTWFECQGLCVSDYVVQVPGAVCE